MIEGDRVSTEETAEPEAGVTDDGANWNVRPAGKPETLKMTAELNPCSEVMLMVAVPEAPWARVSEVVETPI